MKKTNNCIRFWELDTLRGVAIILMILYHTFFILNYFSVCSINLGSFLFRFSALSAEILFFTIVGICLYISYIRNKKVVSKDELRDKFFKRGAKILLWGLLITVSSIIFFPSQLIVFGVLHFIGLSIILSYYFIKLERLNLFLGLLAIIFGYFANQISIGNNYLLVLGFPPANYNTLDYFPLLPWFGVILIGIYLGNTLYYQNKRIFPLNDYSNNSLIQILSFLGKHSLFIYLIHIPIIIVGLLIIEKLIAVQ